MKRKTNARYAIIEIAKLEILRKQTRCINDLVARCEKNGKDTNLDWVEQNFNSRAQKGVYDLEGFEMPSKFIGNTNSTIHTGRADIGTANASRDSEVRSTEIRRKKTDWTTNYETRAFSIQLKEELWRKIGCDKPSSKRNPINLLKNRQAKALRSIDVAPGAILPASCHPYYELTLKSTLGESRNVPYKGPLNLLTYQETSCLNLSSLELSKTRIEKILDHSASKNSPEGQLVYSYSELQIREADSIAGSGDFRNSYILSNFATNSELESAKFGLFDNNCSEYFAFSRVQLAKMAQIKPPGESLNWQPSHSQLTGEDTLSPSKRCLYVNVSTNPKTTKMTHQRKAHIGVSARNWIYSVQTSPFNRIDATITEKMFKTNTPKTTTTITVLKSPKKMIKQPKNQIEKRVICGIRPNDPRNRTLNFTKIMPRLLVPKQLHCTTGFKKI